MINKKQPNLECGINSLSPSVSTRLKEWLGFLLLKKQNTQINQTCKAKNKIKASNNNFNKKTHSEMRNSSNGSTRTSWVNKWSVTVTYLYKLSKYKVRYRSCSIFEVACNKNPSWSLTNKDAAHSSGEFRRWSQTTRSWIFFKAFTGAKIGFSSLASLINVQVVSGRK